MICFESDFIAYNLLFILNYPKITVPNEPLPKKPFGKNYYIVIYA